MTDVLVGVLAVGIGALFCFRGYFAMRLVIPVWGAFAGFVLGAGLVDAATDDGLFVGALSWLVGLAVALAFATLAYLYYEVSVLISMAAVGFALGSSVMAAIGVRWSWLIVLVGVLCGALLAAIAIAADLPMVVLTVLTATAGASTMVIGLMLVVGTLSTDELATTTTETLDDRWWWYVVYASFVVAGMISQIRSTDAMRASLREAWEKDGGRQFANPSSAG